MEADVREETPKKEMITKLHGGHYIVFPIFCPKRLNIGNLD